MSLLEQRKFTAKHTLRSYSYEYEYRQIKTIRIVILKYGTQDGYAVQSHRTVLFSYEYDTVAYIIRVRVRVLYPDISRLCMLATVYSLVIRINSAIRGLNPKP